MLKSIRNSLILSSLLYIVLGVVLLVMPELSLGFACLLIGGAVVIYGVVRLAAYLRGGPAADKLDLVLGVLLILLGLFLLIWIRFLLAFVPVVLGIYILIDSFGSLKRSLDMKALGFGEYHPAGKIETVTAAKKPFPKREELFLFTARPALPGPLGR